MALYPPLHFEVVFGFLCVSVDLVVGEMLGDAGRRCVQITAPVRAGGGLGFPESLLI